jgi:hypothetical protein
MKTRILVLCIFLFFPLAGLKAQEIEQTHNTAYRFNRAHFGIVGGTQLSGFYDELAGDPNFQVGVHAGFTYHMPIVRGIALEPQILYSKKGAEFDRSMLSRYHRPLNYRLHYLEAPLLLNISTNRVLDLIIGGYGGYLFDATYSVRTRYGDGIGELNYADFDPYDYGLVGGFGFNLPYAKFSVKYSQGMRDVLKNAEAYPELEKARNRMLSISFTGYFK